MDFTLKYPIRSNSESSTTIYTSSPEYQLDFKSHWPNNMYSAQHLDTSSKQHLLGGSVTENGKNNSLGRMHSTKQSKSMDNMTNQPKRETLWQSMFKSATNLLSDHLTRGTSSIIKSWSSMNHPLSVTVVSPDLYKSLQQGKDHQLVNSSEGIFATKTWSKDSHSNDETLPNILYSNEFISDSARKSNSDPSDSDRRWKEYKNLYVDFTETQKDLNKSEKIVNSVNSSDCNIDALEALVVDDKKDVDTLTNFSTTLNVMDDLTIPEKPVTMPPEGQEKLQQQLQQQQQQQQQQQKLLKDQLEPEEASSSIPSGTLLSNTHNEIVDDITGSLQDRASSPESEPTWLFTKRACTSPKLRSKKMHTVSSGRGRGRAKSQLRRSGVSQTRHRKQCSRYNQAEDIKSDIDNWKEFEYSAKDGRFEDVDVCDFAGRQPGDCDNGSDAQQFTKDAASFTLGDIEPKKKSKKGKNCDWAEVNSCSAQNVDEDRDLESSSNKTEFRARLLSDSSVDSEDGFRIVFEDDDTNKASDDESEEEDCETESETESESDHEEEVITEKIPTKVRFDLKPTIHLMIKWKFAYRTARPGPWERMGRDRERFRNRIRNTGLKIEPVLSNDHRMRIWCERFEE